MQTALILAIVAGTGVGLIVHTWVRPARRVSLPRRSPFAALDETLLRAGLRLPAGMFLAAIGLGAVGCGAIGVAISGVPLIGILATLAGGWGIVALVHARIRRRRRAHQASWPDVVDHLVASVRSGLALPDAVERLAQTGPAGLRSDFEVYARSYRATGSFPAAIAEVKERLAEPTADRLFETLRMAREVGGSELPAVLRSFAQFLREEQAVRHEVEARASWVINAARLGVAAPWVVLLMLASRPEAAQAYATPGGTIIILVGLAVSIVAYRLTVALGRTRDEGRWFA